ncbi:MAG: hypothetical protein WD512_09850, partial [Candidatus Paceibacterota bacterium]
MFIGIKGLVPQRDFISKSWPKGKNIVMFDDDVQKIDLTMSKLFKGHSLDYFFKYAFEQCKTKHSYIWGVYPVYNPFFRKGRPEMTTNLTYIVGAFYGIINRPGMKELNLSITEGFNGQKEDVERTIKYFIEDGIVIRFDRVGFTTKYYGTTGGLGTFEARLTPMKQASEALLKKFPEYGSIVVRKNGMTEFKVKKLPSKYQIENDLEKDHGQRPNIQLTTGDALVSALRIKRNETKNANTSKKNKSSKKSKISKKSKSSKKNKTKKYISFL